MKQYLTLFLSIVILAAGCSKENVSDKQIGNIDLKPSEETGTIDGLDESVFEILNLDYPGLEKVKSYYESDDLFNAAKSMLEYWRTRPVYNPDVDVLSPSATASEQNIANQATAEGGWRFKVAVYTESAAGVPAGEEQYWSFAGENGEINWNMVPAGLESEKEFLSQKHRLQWMLPQAKAYGFTKDEKYVLAWIEAWKSYNTAFPVPEGTTSAVEWSGLQPCCRMNDLQNVLPYYIHSENFTPEVLFYVLRTSYDHIESIRKNLTDDYTSNIRLSQ